MNNLFLSYLFSSKNNLQLFSDKVPEVEALTWANTKGLLIFSASLAKFWLFHAGVTDANIHGVLSGPGFDSYHPKENNYFN